MKILVIEDNVPLQQSIIEFLAGEGFLCEYAVDYEGASEKIHLYEYDIVLVDIGLPKEYKTETRNMTPHSKKQKDYLSVSERMRKVLPPLALDLQSLNRSVNFITSQCCIM